MPTPEETRRRQDRINQIVRDNRAAKRISDPEGAQISRENATTYHRDRKAKRAEEDPEGAKEGKEKKNSNARESRAAKRENDPVAAEADSVRNRAYQRSRRQQQKVIKAAKEQAAVFERLNSLAFPTSDNLSVDPASPGDLVYDNTARLDHNAAFTMTDMTTSLPPSNPGQPAHSRINLPSTDNHYNQLSMNNLGHPAPPSTHIQTANSTYYPPSTSYNNSGAPTNDNNSLPLARGHGSARPETPAGYESAGLGTSFTQPTSGYYYPSSGTSHEPPVPPSTTVPIVEGMDNYPSEEVNRWWMDTLARGY